MINPAFRVLLPRARKATRLSAIAMAAACLIVGPLAPVGIALAQETTTTPAEPAPALAPVPPETTPAAPAAPETGAAPAPTQAAPSAQAPAVEQTQAPATEAPPAPNTPQPLQPAPPALDGTQSTPILPGEPQASEARTDIPHDLSPWGMFMAADWVVKGVMIGLAFASLVTWTVWLAKSIEIAGASARATKALKATLASPSLAHAARTVGGKGGGPAAYMVRVAEEEMRRSDPVLDYAGNTGIKERVGSHLGRIEAQAGRRLSKGTGVLATIGSTAPFVGLFGTVWGIMNSFIGISEAQTTNLAIVAPGIAEALLATAIGLVAAIPAVVIYNVFARSITGYRQLLADAAAAVERLVSLDLDRRKALAGQHAGALAAE